MMRKLTSALLLLGAFVLSGPALSLLATAQDGDAATATSPVVMTDEQGEYPLGLQLEILEDPDGQLTIEQVASPEFNERFVPNQEKIFMQTFLSHITRTFVEIIHPTGLLDKNLNLHGL